MNPSLRSRFTLPFFGAVLVAALVFSGCTAGPKLEPLVAGKPAFPKSNPSHLEVDVRLPGASRWGVSLDRTPEGWRLGDGEWADSAFVNHLLELLWTFTTVEEAGSGTNEGFGFSPFRVSLTLYDEQTTRTILFGDPSGTSSIFFRRVPRGPRNKGHESKISYPEQTAWIGQGSLIAFFGNLKDPAVFQHPTPYLGRPEDLVGMSLDKLRPPNIATTSFSREGGEWRTDAVRKATLEGILHQRIIRVAPEAKLTGAPDWRVRLSFAGGRSESIEIYFDLDRVWAMNPVRSRFPLELYPAMAGTLRAFTQLRSTPVKSTTK